MANGPALPRRYQPYLAQANTEADVRYGAQQSALQQLRSQAVHDFTQGLLAQHTATQGLLGQLNLAPQEISNGYAASGLTSPLLASLARSGSPTAQRIASEQASALAGIAQQRVGAQAGEVAGINHLTDTYNTDVGNINSQSSALQNERGAFTQDLLNQLIGNDRAAQQAARAEQQKEKFTASQNTAQQNAALQRSTITALLNQGLTPVIGKDGSVSIGPPIPGSKAQQQAAKAHAPKRATGQQQSSAETAFGHSLSVAQQMAQGGTSVDDIVGALVSGRPARSASPGRKVYVTVKTPTGTKQQLKLNPDGTPMTRGGSPAVPAIPGIPQPIAQAVAEQAANGYVSDGTIAKLHHIGYRVLDFPGLVTRQQARQHGTAGYSTGTPSPYGSGQQNNLH